MVSEQGPDGQAGFGQAESTAGGAQGSLHTWARHTLPQWIPKEADS